MSTFPASASIAGAKAGFESAACRPVRDRSLLHGRQLAGLAVGALPLLAFPLLAQVVSVRQCLWLCAAFLGAACAFAPRSSAVTKVLEIFAASALGTLALVDIDV